MHKFKGVESVRKIETGLERGQRLWGKLRNTVLMHSMRRGDPPWKSSSPIRGAEYFRPLHKFIGVKSARKIEAGLERGQRLPRKPRNTMLMREPLSKGRSEPPRKSPSPICAAEYFRPLHKLIGVKSVRKNETGLERGRWLSRKLRNTVLTQQRSTMSTCHSNFQFSQQSLIAFEPRFDFLA